MRSRPLTVVPAALRSLALRNGTAPRPPPVRSSVQHAAAPPRSSSRRRLRTAA
eukprot:IDg2028t1